MLWSGSTTAELRFIHLKPATSASDNMFSDKPFYAFASSCVLVDLCLSRFVRQLDVVTVTDTRQSNQNVFIIIEANLSAACVCAVQAIRCVYLDH